MPNSSSKDAQLALKWNNFLDKVPIYLRNTHGPIVVEKFAKENAKWILENSLRENFISLLKTLCKNGILPDPTLVSNIAIQLNLIQNKREY